MPNPVSARVEDLGCELRLAIDSKGLGLTAFGSFGY
jgi:hypothetical protein